MPSHTEQDLAQRVLTLLAQHRTIRHFEPDELPQDLIHRTVRAAQMASTSSNVQAYSLLRVRSPNTRAELAALCGDQEQVARSGAFFVVSGDQRRHRLAAERHGRPFRPNLESFMVAVIDAALFAQNLCVGFEAAGYGICYIGGLRTRLEEVDRLLELPEDVLPLFGLCVGVPAKDPARFPSLRPRLPLEAVLFEERYPDKDRLAATIDEYDATMRSYYGERGQRGYDWSAGIARKFERRQREHLWDFYSHKGASLE